MSLGFDPGQFWLLTPRELHIYHVGANERLRREHNDRAWLAHTSAALHRIDPKRFPKLDKLLVKSLKPKRKQTREEMLAVLRVMAATMRRR